MLETLQAANYHSFANCSETQRKM